MADLCEDFTSKQLLLHPGEVQWNPIKALGIRLDGQRLSSSIAPDRLHRVRQGLRCVLHRGRCTWGHRKSEIAFGVRGPIAPVNQLSLQQGLSKVGSPVNGSRGPWMMKSIPLRLWLGPQCKLPSIAQGHVRRLPLDHVSPRRLEASRAHRTPGSVGRQVF